MISVTQALSFIDKQVKPSEQSEVIHVDDALGRILYEDVTALISLPSFRQSVMDGYAINPGESNTYRLAGEVKAGDAKDLILQPGETVRIFTGARVPDSAQAVVMQEHVQVTGNEIVVQREVTPGMNIRSIGEQIGQGDTCFSRGFRINPSAIGLLRSFGITEVRVSRIPRVSILVTGSELIQLGAPLSEGKIYESNSGLIRTALQQRGIDTVQVIQVEDSPDDTLHALEKLFSSSDLVLVSGGISVGDYDLVGKALEDLNVQQHFYKVRQKPGKPLYFGSRDNTYVLALPGNPASTLTCLYIYGFRLIDILSGAESAGLSRLRLPLKETVQNHSERALFLKARIEDNQVMPLHLQQSSAVLSFALANALIYVPEDSTEIAPGSLVDTLLLP